MARHVKAERRALARQELAGIPWVDRGELAAVDLYLFLVDLGQEAEQILLPARALALQLLAALEADVDAAERARPMDGARRVRVVERAALHQRLEHALVELAQIDASGEVEQVF